MPLTIFLLPVHGQITSNASCLTTFSWTVNSYGQDPCLVAAYLQSPCNSGSFEMNALKPNTHYSGPASDNPCQCNSVLYSLVSACSACQGEPYDSWTDWNANCVVVYVQEIPVEMPKNTSVPIWAYTSIPPGGSFNLSAAQVMASQGIPDQLSPSAQPNGTGVSRTSPASSTGLGPNVEKAVIAIVSIVLFFVVAGSITFVGLKLRKYRRQQKEKHHINTDEVSYFKYEAPPSVQSEMGDSHDRIREFTAAVEAAISQSRQSLATSWHHREDSTDTMDTMVPLMTAQTAYTGYLEREPSQTAYTGYLEREPSQTGLATERNIRLLTSASQMTLPSLFVPQEEEEYTPAAESSNMYYNTTTGHSPASEHQIVIQDLPSGCLPPQR